MPLLLPREHKFVDNETPAAGLPPMPVIVGAPRSGTTLLRVMLDAHPELAIPPETGFLTLGAKFRGTGDVLRQQFFRGVTNFPSEASAWPDFQLSEESFWLTLSQIDPFTVSAGYRTFYRMYAARFDKRRWGDKTPLYCMDIEPIRNLLPEARFIHLIRDGRDVVLSLRRMWFAPGQDIETLAGYWRKCVLTARKAGLNHSDYLEVRYEDLILNTPEILKQISQFVDLNYDEKMLRYYTRSESRLKEHQARFRADGSVLITQEDRLNQQRRTIQPPDPACIGAWKSEMTPDEQSRFWRVAGGLLEELGYKA
ncbi:MAG: hypothetical protein QOE77_3114 [Blastocatellia bacterium]|nr:hypothetical protein [Blastocatellia bacterium]